MKDMKFLNLTPGVPVNADNNDITYGSDGNALTLESYDRRIQDTIKLIITGLSSNPIFRSYGTVAKFLGGKRSLNDFKSELSDSLTQGFGFLQAIETSQKKDERIKSFSMSLQQPQKQEILILLTIEFEDGYVTPPISVNMLTGG